MGLTSFEDQAISLLLSRILNAFSMVPYVVFPQRTTIRKPSARRSGSAHPKIGPNGGQSRITCRTRSSNRRSVPASRIRQKLNRIPGYPAGRHHVKLLQLAHIAVILEVVRPPDIQAIPAQPKCQETYAGSDSSGRNRPQPRAGPYLWQAKLQDLR